MAWVQKMIKGYARLLSTVLMLGLSASIAMLAGCNVRETASTVGASETRSNEQSHQSSEASALVRRALGNGYLGFSSVNGAWATVYQSQWEVDSSGSVEPYQEYELAYDSDKELVKQTTSNYGSLSSEQTWAYEGDTTTYTTIKNPGSDNEQAQITTSTRDGDNEHRETVEFDGTKYTVDITTEQIDDGSTETTVQRDATGAVMFSNVLTCSDDGKPIEARSYAGEPERSSLTSEQIYTYDEQGRRISNITYSASDDETASNYGEYCVYGDDGSRALLSFSEDAHSDALHYTHVTAFDDQGRLVYAYRSKGSAPRASIYPIEYVVSYDEFDNPAVMIGWQNQQPVYKQTFSYDSDGRLLSAVEFSNDLATGVISGRYFLFGYENLETGEKVEPRYDDTIELPTIEEKDYALTVADVVGQEFIDAIYQDSSLWEAEIPEGMYDSSKPGSLGVACVPAADRPYQLMVYITDEGSLSVEWTEPAYHYQTSGGQVLLIGCEGTRLVLTPSGESAYSVRGTLGASLEVDTVLTGGAS